MRQLRGQLLVLQENLWEVCGRARGCVYGPSRWSISVNAFIIHHPEPKKTHACPEETNAAMVLFKKLAFSSTETLHSASHFSKSTDSNCKAS